MRAVPEPILHVLRGLLMGAADVIPGVSGGTVALVVGIYERFVGSVSAGASALFRFARLDLDGGRRRWKDVEWTLVIPLGLGIVTALVIGSRIIPGLLEAYPSEMRAVFFGLILGSLAVPYRRMSGVETREIALIVVFALIAFVLVGLPPREIAEPPLPLVFVLAAIAICAMILPGVSGAFMLLAFGIYRPTLEALSGLDLPYILVFVAGAGVGLGLFSQVLTWLLEHRHDVTMAALVGLMAGSLRALWPWLDEDRALLAPPDLTALALAGVLAAVGVAVVVLVTWLAGQAPTAQVSQPGPSRR
jgi:putative membrane protein